MNNKEIKVSSLKEVIDQITADKLDQIISDGSFKIIDVREPKGIETQGSIPGAINVPHDTIDQDLQDYNENRSSVFNSNGPFLFCCTGGVMSYMAAIKAKENGIKLVYNLEGGHSAWMKIKEAHFSV